MVSMAAVKAAGARATRASAKLENREVPADYVRPDAVQRYIDECGSGTRRGPSCGLTEVRPANAVGSTDETRIPLSQKGTRVVDIDECA